MASRSLNKVTLIGNLTRDPELKYIPQGTAVCSFGLATNRAWTTKSGDIKEDVQFHRIVAWNKLAELCGSLLSKGRKVYLEGRIIYRSYEGKDGAQRQITEIIIDDFILFDDRRKDGSTDGTHAEGSTATAAPSHDEHDLPESEETTEEPANSGKVDPDDIPF